MSNNQKRLQWKRTVSIVCLTGMLIQAGCSTVPKPMSASGRDQFFAQHEVPAIHGEPPPFKVGKTSSYIKGGLILGVIAGLFVPTIVARENSRYSENSQVAMGAAVGVAALLGLAAGAAIHGSDKETGRRIAGELALPDPILEIKDLLLGEIRRESGTVELKNIPEIQPTEVPYEIKKRYRDTLLLDFKSTRWEFMDGRLKYEARVRLLDTRFFRTLWRGVCRFAEDPRVKALEVADLKADDGKMVREKISRAVTVCVEQLGAQFKGLPLENYPQFQPYQGRPKLQHRSSRSP